MNKHSIALCSHCGNDIEADDLLIDNLYPLNREKTRWNICCAYHNGGCGRHVYGQSEEEVINRWNNKETDEFLY